MENFTLQPTEWVIIKGVKIKNTSGQVVTVNVEITVVTANT